MNQNNVKRAFSAAFPRTLPVFAGYLFLGMTYGIYLNTSGLPLWFPLIMTLTIFSGSAELITVGLLLESFNPASAFAISAITGARYLFYGISMLDRFKGTGWKKFYLIYGTVDETFSIIYQSALAPDIDRGWFMLFVTALDHAYWIFGVMVGALAGTLITFNTAGLDFVMVSMFVIIFLNQWMTEKKHKSELIGGVCALLSLIVFGKSNFLIPAMALIVACLTAFRKPLEKATDENERFKEERAKRLAVEHHEKLGAKRGGNAA